MSCAVLTGAMKRSSLLLVGSDSWVALTLRGKGYTGTNTKCGGSLGVTLRRNQRFREKRDNFRMKALGKATGEGTWTPRTGVGLWWKQEPFAH